LARETCETFLREAEAEGRATEAASARSMLGLIMLNQGELNAARSVLERALADHGPRRDGEAGSRFWDAEVSATAVLAAVEWHLGEAEGARELINRAVRRAEELGILPIIGVALNWRAVLESQRHDALATRNAADAVLALAEEHGIKSIADFNWIYVHWARGQLLNPEEGAVGFRQELAAFMDKGLRLGAPFYHGLLAELEATSRGPASALALIERGLSIAEETEQHLSDPYLHGLRGEILLRRDLSNPNPAEEAFQAAIAIARQQAARSWGLRAALSLAKLYQSTARSADAHAVLAPALEGFSPTPEMPEIAEAQSLLGALAETEEVKAAEMQRQRRLHLQTAYGQAMMWAKGFSAEEARAAFSRARELAAKTDSFTDRFAAGHFQWSFAYLRGELHAAQELELSFLKEAEETSRVVEVGVARRGLALACYYATDFSEARMHCERALEACDAESERETQERFQDATGPLVMSVLAVTMWQLGEVDRARELIEQANRRASELGHAPSMAHPLLWKSHLEILRGDPAAALIAAEALQRLSQEHGLPFWRTYAELSVGWARGRLHDAATGAEDLSRALADRIEQGGLNDAWFFEGLLAELEAETQGLKSALARLDEAMALARQVETRCNLPFLHLLRGKLLLERDPSNPASAEEAFRTALAIAQEQGARSWGLRAALSLAKLYQSTARPVDAHAVLAPALEGFSPTPEMPEIAEAQAVLAVLAGTDEVRAVAAGRRRRLKLQTDYSRALLWSKGFSAGETSAALADASKLAAGTTDFGERFAGYYGAWIGSLSGGDLARARQVAETFTREAKGEDHAPSLARACLCLGVTSFLQGKFAEAWTELEEALRTYDTSWDRDAKLRFGPDTGAIATAFLANASWSVGEIERAREQVEQSVACAIRSEDVPSKVNVYVRQAALEAVRGDAEAVLRVAEILVELSQEYGLAQWLAWGNSFRGWAKVRVGGRDVGVKEIQEGIAVLAEQESRLYMPFIQGLLADIESGSVKAP
jgi:predicted ATPase